MNVCQLPNVYNVPLHVDEGDGTRSCRALFARSFCIKKLYISSNDVNFLSFNNDDMEPSKRKCFFLFFIFGYL